MRERKNYGHARGTGLYVDINAAAGTSPHLHIIIAGDFFDRETVDLIKRGLERWLTETGAIDDVPIDSARDRDHYGSYRGPGAYVRILKANRSDGASAPRHLTIVVAGEWIDRATVMLIRNGLRQWLIDTEATTSRKATP